MRIAALLALLLLPVFAAAAAEPGRLARVDAFRLPRSQVMAQVEVVEVSLPEGKRGESHDYRVFLNKRLDSVVEMRSAAERGRRVLMTDDAVWLHIPSSARPIRITPLQRLLGQANFGDVGRLTWDGSYRIAVEEDAAGFQRPAIAPAAEAVGARFRALDGHPVRLLRLEAVSATATYPRIDVWVSAVDSAPLRADYFLTSGKRLKTGWFTDPVATPQGAMVRGIVFHDEQSVDRVTVMNTSAVTDHELPGSFFAVRGFMADIGR